MAGDRLNEDQRIAVKAFAREILHGDEEYRRWLIDAANCFCVGNPTPKIPNPSAIDGWRDVRRAARGILSNMSDLELTPRNMALHSAALVLLSLIENECNRRGIE